MIETGRARSWIFWRYMKRGDLIGWMCGRCALTQRLSWKIRWSSVVDCFFQAEDGIRDLTVTGVQTCALPICPCAQSSISSVVRCMARPVIGLSYGLRLGRVSLTAPFQVAAQFITGPMDIGLDRAQRQLQCGRDFLVGIALDVP